MAKSGGLSVLEIGPALAGPVYEHSVTIDSNFRQDITFRCEWGKEDFPFIDEIFDLVYASHVLEHVPWYRTNSALKEVHRVLKPGGRVEVWVPDFEKIVGIYLNGRITDTFPEENWTPFNDERSLMKWVAGRLMCGTKLDEESSWHRSVFDANHLERCLSEAGFKNIERLEKQPEGQKVNHDFINLGMQGIK